MTVAVTSRTHLSANSAAGGLAVVTPQTEESAIWCVSNFLLESKDPARVALCLLDGEKTYGDVASASFAVAQLLLARGHRKGERVLLRGENSFFWVATYLGILQAGLICVPLPVGISAADLHYIHDVTEPCLTFAQARIVRRDQHPCDSPLIIDAPVPVQHGLSVEGNFEEIISAPCSVRPTPHLSRDDLAALMFTSGTTGKPRGVMVSHGNIVANTESIIQALGLAADDRMMAVLPFHYCFGASLLHTHLRIGGSLVLDPRFLFPDKVLERMQQTQCTGFAGVPSHYQILLRRSSFQRMQFPHLRHLQQAGGHLAPAFVHELRGSFPNVKTFVMYGQTEATARLSCMPVEMLDKKPGSIGKGIPGVRLRVMNAGREVSPGETGEIVAEGNNITRGYWRAPEETAASFRGRSLHTGDIATVDEDGYIYVVDRAKEFLKCGGTRISCRRIEEQLLEFGGLLEAAVVGMPDEILGEAVKAFVVPRNTNHENLEDELIEFCRRTMASTAVPRSFVILDALPRNESGKVLKSALRHLTNHPVDS